MKNFLVTLMLLCLVASAGYAQVDYQINSAMDFFRANKMATGDYKQQLTESDIDGSPYLNDEFINGSVFTTSKVKFENVLLRYNIYSDDLEFKTPEKKVLALSAPEVIEKVIFGEYTMAYVPYVNVKKVRRGFFLLLQEGNATLYARNEINYQKPQEPGAYKEAEPAKFIRRPDIYYIRFGKEAAIKVGNKKETIAMFPKHKDEIGTFIKKNKIKTSKVESLKKLLDYYNSL